MDDCVFNFFFSISPTKNVFWATKKTIEREIPLKIHHNELSSIMIPKCHDVNRSYLTEQWWINNNNRNKKKNMNCLHNMLSWLVTKNENKKKKIVVNTAHADPKMFSIWIIQTVDMSKRKIKGVELIRIW